MTTSSQHPIYNLRCSPSCFREEQGLPPACSQKPQRAKSEQVTTPSRRASCADHVRATPLATNRQLEHGLCPPRQRSCFLSPPRIASKIPLHWAPVLQDHRSPRGELHTAQAPARFAVASAAASGCGFALLGADLFWTPISNLTLS